MRSARAGTGRSAAQRLLSRAAFAVPLLGFLILGIVLVGDFSAQWWVLLLPVALLVGPALVLRRETRKPSTGSEETRPWSESGR